ncbi:hypothetical protein D3C81_1225930 [compost metagenome]
MWGIDHADGSLLARRQRKELAGMALHLFQQIGINAMAGQVEKAHVPCRMTQIVKKPLTLCRSAIEQ